MKHRGDIFDLKQPVSAHKWKSEVGCRGKILPSTSELLLVGVSVSVLSKNKDIMFKNYFDKKKSESHPHEYYLNKSLRIDLLLNVLLIIK